MKKRTFIFFFLLCIFLITSGQVKFGIRDEQGRHVIPRGFVVNTEDSKGTIFYTPEDYHRMARMGANFQVIRLKMGSLGGYPGTSLKESYLLHLDSLVQMGKNAGMKTDFKMTVYGTSNFSWTTFWENKNGEYDGLTAAWSLLWERYRDEPAVFGYDLLNEPRKGDLEVSYAEMEEKYLVPLYRRLIDASQRINPGKKCLFQPILVNDPDRKSHPVPFIEMRTPVNRKNIMYAPHIYESNNALITKWIERYLDDASVSGVPLFFGEWGPATYDDVDSSMVAQTEYQDFYMETAHVFDSLGVGTIKAWFTGTRFTGTSARGPYTWSIFKDNQGVGTIERKYITDIIARPYPQCIAGDLMFFSFDYATRSLEMEIMTENEKGASRIFIPADRYYPDGFTITAGETQLILNPQKNLGLEVISAGNADNPAEFIWDPYNQQLVVLRWPENHKLTSFKVQPGLFQEILFR